MTDDIHIVLAYAESFTGSLLLVIGTFQSFEIVRKLDCPDPEIQTRYVIKFTVVSLKNNVTVTFHKRENIFVFFPSL